MTSWRLSPRSKSATSWQLPLLRKTTRNKVREFRIYSQEWHFVRVAFCPDPDE